MRKRIQIEFKDPSLTKQSFKDDCNVNQILMKWMKTGEAPQAPAANGYGDFTNVDDYQTAMNRVVEAEANFMSLPSKIRSRFHNDPSEFLAFFNDPSNVDEAVKLGLAVRNPAPAAPPVEP